MEYFNSSQAYLRYTVCWAFGASQTAVPVGRLTVDGPSLPGKARLWTFDDGTLQGFVEETGSCRALPVAHPQLPQPTQSL